MLFDAFIPAAYRHDPVGRWKAQDVDRWLVFLARHLEHTIGDPDLAWWQLPLAVRGFQYYAVGVMAGPAVLAVVLAGVLATPAAVVFFGVVFLPFFAGMLGSRTPLKEPRPVRIRWQPLSRRTLKVGVVIGAAVGFVFWLGFTRAFGIESGVLAGVLAGVSTGSVAVVLPWARNQKVAPLDLRSAASPRTVLVRDRSTATVLGGTAGVVFGTVLFRIFLQLGVVGGIAIGVLSGAVAGAIISLALAAWPSYGTARALLALRHELPWALMSFLADAHRRGVLRQAGAVYQFRHIELQHRLANRDANDQKASSSAASPVADG
jgi:hypothetical protein